MRIAYLGAGTWGFCLACLLASKGHRVVLWTAKEEFAKTLEKTRQHPKLPKFQADERLSVTWDLKQALDGAEFVIESVTSKGVRSVFEQISKLGGWIVLLSSPLKGSSKIADCSCLRL